MKKVIFAITLCYSCFIHGQNEQNVSLSTFSETDLIDFNVDMYDGVIDSIPDYLTAAMNIKNEFGLDSKGYVTMTNIINCPNLTKAQIIAYSNDFLVSFFGLKETADREAGFYEANRYFNDEMNEPFQMKIKNKLITVAPQIYMNMRFEVKDGRCRFTTSVENYNYYQKEEKKGVSAGKVALSLLVGPVALIDTKTPKITQEVWNPQEHYPFTVEEFKETEKMKKKEIREGKAEIELRNKAAATAYVMSYSYSQVLFTKLSKILNEANDNANW